MRALWMALLAIACEPARPPAEAPKAEATPAHTSAKPATIVDPPDASSLVSNEQAESDGTACGALNCRSFTSDVAAFSYILKTNPRILGVGEAHAQQGTEQIESATKRFAERLLPTLERRASDVIVELLLADGSCKREQQAVAEKQKPVTSAQAASNQNEFVLLGNQAKRFGMTPHALRPSCEDYQRVAQAGATDISLMLELIASETERTIKTLHARRPAQALIVTYGGALHNDVAPRQGRESWSFGPQLAELSAGRYLELDLIVPEYVKDTDTWRALPWFEHFRAMPQQTETLVYNPNPGSFVLIFPRSAQATNTQQGPTNVAPHK
jgi:hypothetical protein